MTIGEKRQAKLGIFTLIAAGDGYVMARQAACYPVVWTLKYWESLPVVVMNVNCGDETRWPCSGSPAEAL